MDPGRQLARCAASTSRAPELGRPRYRSSRPNPSVDRGRVGRQSEVEEDPSTGTLNVRRGLKLLGELQAAVASNPPRTLSFEIAGTDGNARAGGRLRLLGRLRQQGRRHRAPAQRQDEADGRRGERDDAAAVGVPLVAEFGFTRAEDTITVQPRVAFLGRAGEEWHTILPDAKSPKLMVFGLLATKRFEGC